VLSFFFFFFWVQLLLFFVSSFKFLLMSSFDFPLPSSVAQILSECRTIGICGSRMVVPSPYVWRPFVAAVPVGASISCGCVGGVCALVRFTFCEVSVFRASVFGFGVQSFVRRSVALVQSVASSPFPLWVSFPGFSCPVGLVPHCNSSECFNGGGSGSWASLAFAVGCGVPALVHLSPSAVSPPGWSLIGLGGGWFFIPSVI
jgi:hypothetical protein